MLMYHTNLDEHLDFLENQSRHCFFLSRKEEDIPAFIEKCQTEILENAYKHTMLIIEQPTTQNKNSGIRRVLKKFGAKIDDIRVHHIHAFIVPPLLYEVVVNAYEEGADE